MTRFLDIGSLHVKEEAASKKVRKEIFRSALASVVATRHRELFKLNDNVFPRHTSHILNS